MIEKCPVCGSARSQEIDRREGFPVLMNRVYPTRSSARAAVCGLLDMRGCDDCGFAWNRAFDPKIIAYDADYENDQTHSPAFAAHVQDRVADVLAAVPADHKLNYLEIGCGQGGFIGKVAAAAGDRLGSASGFDPAWRGPDTRGPHGSRIHNVYFDAAAAALLEGRPNVVVSRHTIEHVPDPLGFLQSLRTALGPASTARVFIETPCISWILEHQAMQDLFYEHCSIFTGRALRHALELSGFRVRRITHVFGGQYLWAEAEASTDVPLTELPKASGPGVADIQQRFTTRWRAAVDAAKADGVIAIWGAGAKGVTFARLTDPDNRLLDHAIDINPRKQGLFLAGGGLPVLAPVESAQRNPRTIFVMNPNYMDEIKAIASSANIAANLIPIE